MSLANYSLGQLPAVFGEFGSYFNLNGIENAVADNYTVVAHILDNEYQGFEKLFVSRFVWCYGAENDAFYGDGWNHEDFSLFGPGQVPRAELAWGRPHARALAGKPISTHFYSDLHYFDPQKGLELPRREFEVRYASKETPAPTEIMVPTSQYPDGFYVWVSAGRCHYAPKSLTLYHYPSEDVPDFVHWVRVLPRLPNRESKGWSYYFKGESAVVR